MLDFLVIFFALLISTAVVAYTIYYLRRERRRVREDNERRFRTTLIRLIRKSGISQLDFDRVVEENQVPRDVASQAAAKIYASLCEAVFADGQVTESERRQLEAFAKALKIPAQVTVEVETSARHERYRDAALSALADGRVTAEEASELRELRRRMGISDRISVQIVGGAAIDAYLAVLRDATLDGRITSSEVAELKRIREATGLSREEANGLAREEAMSLYYRWFCNVLQDGEVTPDEENGLAWLREEFGLHSETRRYEADLQEVKRLASYRRGDLPALNTGKFLEGGEISHWEGRCCFQWRTPTQFKEANGELLVTSDRLVFSSPVRSFALAPSKIIDISIFSDGLLISTSSARGSGRYFVDHPRELEAILVGVTRRHKFQTVANYSSDMSRHIPDDVRRKVWQRDGGRCVRCKATDYLEFDHIIPHSRGGASTEGNVQLLCRRCNLLKSDRI